MLLLLLLLLKVTVDDGTERFSVSVSHEATGTCSPESHFLVLLQLSSRIALAIPHYILYSHVVIIRSVYDLVCYLLLPA